VQNGNNLFPALTSSNSVYQINTNPAYVTPITKYSGLTFQQIFDVPNLYVYAGYSGYAYSASQSSVWYWTTMVTGTKQLWSLNRLECAT
jgi:hypothetical protein